MNRRHVASVMVWLSLILAGIAVVWFGPVTRPPSFHVYADQRTLAGIPHFGDVVSNLGFLLVGAMVLARRGAMVPAGIGLIAIGIGSAAYHWSPDDVTLVFDWIPIVVTLSLVLVLVMLDRFGQRAALATLATAPLVSASTVIYWFASGGTTDHGNMAPYVAVQALGVSLPLVVGVAPGNANVRWLAGAVAAFGLARLAAKYDAAILEAVGISGHSLKHVIATAAAALALHAVRGVSPDRSRAHQSR